MSASLDAFLDPARLAALLANDQAMGVVPVKLSAFLVKIGPRGKPRLQFGAMSPSAAQCFNQHMDLALEGERVEIVGVKS